jgi:hypothetical protein
VLKLGVMHGRKVSPTAYALLLACACAKGAEGQGDDDSYAPPSSGGAGGTATQAGSGSMPNGTGGSVMQSGGTGGSPATGGSSAVGGTGGSVMTGGASGSAMNGGTGGSAMNGGRSATGGVAAVGGASTSGGATGSGGAGGMGGGTSMGGASNGGVDTSGGAAGSPSGGMVGAAGLPNDPNWKPPDMSAAKIIVLYQAQQKEAMTYSIGMMLQLKNQTDTAYDLSNVTIRYWFSSEAAPMPRFDYTAQGLSAASAPTFVGNMSNSYIELSFKTGGTVPIYVDQNSLNNTNMSVAVQAQSNTGQFTQGNDWSYDSTASAYKANPKITAYDGDTLIWGCEPSHVCATVDAPTGTAGSGAM